MMNMEQHHGQIRMTFKIQPAVCLVFVTNLLSTQKAKEFSLVDLSTSELFTPEKSENGRLARWSPGETGKTLAYALDNLQQRGRLYIPANTEVYAGMIIGDTSKGDDMTVNPIKGKKLINIRAAGSDDNVILAPPIYSHS